jgi:putative glycosyltransferase (TIGR04372 family)
MVEQMFVQGDMRGVFSSLAQLASEGDLPPWALHLLSRAHLAAGQVQEAVEVAIRAYQTAPHVGEYVIHLAEILIGIGHDHEASELLLSHTQAFPNAVEVLRACVNCQHLLLRRRQSEYQEQTRTLLGRFKGLLAAVLGDRKLVVDTLEHPFIGGLAIDAALFPKYKAAGLLQDMVFLSGRPANEQLLTMLGRHIPIVRDETINVMQFVTWDGEKSKYVIKESDIKRAFFGEVGAELFDDIISFTHTTNGRTLATDEQRLALDARSEKICFSQDEEERGYRFMEERLNIPKDSWHVCVFARDPTFYKETSESPNYFRNSNMENMAASIERIAAHGGYSVRMGSSVGASFSHPSALYRDYASLCRDDFMDIFLVGKCRMYIGTYNGLSHVPFAFGRPLLNINTVNLVGGSATMFLPKKIREATTGEYLPFPEAVRRLYLSPLRAQVWEDGVGQARHFGFIYEENSPDEIADATEEMLAIVEGTYVESNEDKRLRDAYLDMWRAIDQTPPVNALISARFLRRHQDLLRG